ncbi:MAG: Nucleolar protein 58 [Bogoriella megaspora]|nr:MAG: Nucleolar protein 58 [Bogoriella megaspora]
MTLLILTETSAGYALLKAKDKKLLKRDDLIESTETAEGLKQFTKFDSATTALEEAAALTEGKVTPVLASMLDSIKDEKRVSLAVADPKLGNAINKLPQLSITPISDSSTTDLFRAIRSHLPSLIPGLLPEEISQMSLGLSHSLSRHKLRFSPDKVDTMIIQAIGLLDDLDKELNIYAMRVKEWYGWHFPEMARIINDNLAYSKVILKMGIRSKASATDFSEILPEEIEAAVKAAAEVSMGTEITAEDLDCIVHLAEQVVDFSDFRSELSSYLSARMQAIAPNLTELVGDLVGARLIAHAGSLLNLAKSPASTIQILGAEKALFRALKTKHDTPKYGLIFHASLIGQATGKNKGKVARMLATKTALGLRVDALSDPVTAAGAAGNTEEEERALIGKTGRLKVERRLRHLEGRPLGPRGTKIGPNGETIKPDGKWSIKEARKYNPDADGLTGDEPAGSSTVNGTNGTAGLTTMVSAQAGAGAEDDEDEEMEDDVDAAEVKAEAVLDEKAAKRLGKEAKREAKAAKKLAKEAKRAAKEAKKARKAEKTSEANGSASLESSKKKRKAEDGEGRTESSPSSSKKRKNDTEADGGERKKKKKHRS